MKSYINDNKLYLGKDRQNKTQIMAATHATLRSLTGKVEGAGSTLFMDNFFSPPDLHDLHTRGINCCRTIKKIIKEFQGSLPTRRAVIAESV
jgi:hypothetical protein